MMSCTVAFCQVSRFSWCDANSPSSWMLTISSLPCASAAARASSNEPLNINSSGVRNMSPSPPDLGAPELRSRNGSGTPLFFACFALCCWMAATAPGSNSWS